MPTTFFCALAKTPMGWLCKIFAFMAQEEILPRETARVRKVVQISTMVHPEKDWAFIALCDDESLWLYHGSWSRIENIPQTTDL
jgi:hypothetical protein